MKHTLASRTAAAIVLAILVGGPHFLVAAPATAAVAPDLTKAPPADTSKPFDQDARKSFGAAIDQAETEQSKGILKLVLWRQADQPQGLPGQERK